MNSRLNDVDYLLAGDVGGTKTTLTVFDIAKSRREPLDSRTFTNDEYNSFDRVLREFKADTPIKFNSICLGVAGPVINEQVALTNIDWQISAAALLAEQNVEHVWLINDLQASAEAIELLSKDELISIHSVPEASGGNIAVIAPGTGLGEAFLTRKGSKYTAHPTEGGHSDFAPRTERQLRLFEFMQSRYGHVSVESVCSGTAIPALYEFLSTEESITENEQMRRELAKSKDFSASVFEYALDAKKDCKICDETLDLFLEILGAEMSNLVLKIGASGGIYLGGGIPPKITKAFRRKIFLDAYFEKGRYRKYLEKVPIWLILNDKSPLMGAANYGYKQNDKRIGA